MDLTHAGSYGRLKVVKERFLKNDIIDKLSGSGKDEFIKLLGSTSYRKEIDELSGLYEMPDLVEVVINAHMAGMIKIATIGLAPLSKEFIAAYVSKWDIENIKTVLSSKALGYSVENTDVFLIVQRSMPVGIFSGMMARDDFRKLIEEKDIEGIAKALLRYGYGTVLLKYIDDAKNKDVTKMIAALDLFYFTRLLQSYKPYDSAKDSILKFIRESIDIKNITTALKARDYGQKDIKEFIINGGTLQDVRIEKFISAKPEDLGALMPYDVGAAIELYKRSGTISHIEIALRMELYRKYLKQFESAPISLEFVLAFIIRCEIERDELRSIWFAKYYNIGKESAQGMQILTFSGGKSGII
jgi:V/A-type H+-transporting ATPase subunit C